MKPIANFITRSATKKTVLGASLISVAYMIPYATVAFKGEQAKGMLIDQRLFSSPATFHHILAGYGTTLRAQYIRAELVDLLIAGVAFTIALIVGYACKKQGWRAGWVLIPLLAGVLNTIKVALFVPLIATYPHESSVGVWLANIVNLPKDLAMLATVMLLAVSLVGIAKKRSAMSRSV